MDPKQYRFAIVGVNLISAGLIAALVVRDAHVVRAASIESRSQPLTSASQLPDSHACYLQQPLPEPMLIATPAPPVRPAKVSCSNICPHACMTRALKPFLPWGM